MAFRLSSFIAGAAKKGSERLASMEEDMKEQVKLSATNIASEMSDIRKKRIENATGYKKTARNLQSRYNLNDKQIEVVLAGGIENAESFIETIKQGEARAFAENKAFDRDAFIADRFTFNEDATAMDVEQQAQAYASMLSPRPTDDAIGKQAQQISASTRSLLGQVSPDVAKAMIEAEVTARGGKPITSYTGRDFGNIGSVKMADMTVQDMLGMQKLIAETEGMQAQTDKTIQETIVSEAFLPFDMKEKAARVAQIGATIDLTKAQTDNILTMLPVDVKYKEAQISSVLQNVKQSEATIAKMVSEGKLTEANTDFIRGKIAKLSVDTKTAEMLQGLSVSELEAKISSMQSASNLNDKRSQMLDKDIEWADIKAQSEVARIISTIEKEGVQTQTLQQELKLLNQFGAKDRQSALDLIEAKILQAGKYTDLEQFQVSILSENKRLEDMLATGSVPVEEEELYRKLISDNNSRIASSALALSDTEGFQELLSKGQAPIVYNHMIKQNLQGFGIDQQYSSLEQVISNIDQTQYPQYFGAVINGIKEFDNVYGNDRQGYAYASQKMISMNNMLADYARRIGEPVDTTGLSGRALKQAKAQNTLASLNLGQMTMDEIGNHTGQEGEVVSYKDPNDPENTIYAVYTGGTFVSAKF